MLHHWPKGFRWMSSAPACGTSARSPTRSSSSERPAARISPEFRDRHPEIQWRRIIGVRNRLAHDYQQTDWEIIWTILHELVPGLLGSLDALLPDVRE